MTLDADKAVGAIFDRAPAQTAPTTTTTVAPPPAVCLVPAVTGLTLAAAKRHIAATRCRLGQITRRPGRTALVGKVIGQHPAGRTYVAAGSRVALIVGARR